MLKQPISRLIISCLSLFLIVLCCSCTIEKNREFRLNISDVTNKFFARSTVTMPVFATWTATNPPSATPTTRELATATPSLTPSLTVSPVPVITATFSSIELSALPNSQSDSISNIADTNYPDGSILKPGQVFVKCWELQNSGGEIWEQNTRLAVSMDGLLVTPQITRAIFLKDANLIDFSISTWGTRVFNVTPGETVNLAVPLVAPQEPGEYQYDFHLINANDEIIPVRFWIHFYVEALPSNAELTETASPAASIPTSRYETPEPTATLTTLQRPYEWSGTWVIRDPYQKEEMRPLTAWLNQNGEKLSGFFYDSENEPVLIQGSLFENSRVFKGEFARPWLNHATPVTWRMLANKDQFYAVTEGGNIGQGCVCGGRNGFGFPESCALPDNG